TVGVAGMEDPYSGRVEGNKLYGRGADDMKAAMAAALVLLETIARADDFPGKLIVTFVVDEEHSSIGTEAICNEIDRWNPDAALILEATGLNLCIAHKGFVWATITTQGFAAHGSLYAIGVDAIAHMGRVLSAFEKYTHDLAAREPHPLVGPPSMHASLIRGGQELSSYPDICVLEIERRTIPGESRESVTRELQEMLDALADEDEQFQATLEIGLSRDSFEIDREAEIVQTIARIAAAERGETPEVQGAAGWMDSSLLDKAGVPVVIFGPDGVGGHGLVEWADLDVLETFAQILGQVCYEYCAAG
ncbi:MAG: M20/M25/M40 family metallo-hydrolase, partial [Thermomicrobiales bacterium]|nr:M20/M25/M40 family metallo-hydrolase [Thermomicrobiales bacterium]